jgi:hypothetical protein
MRNEAKQGVQLWSANVGAGSAFFAGGVASPQWKRHDVSYLHNRGRTGNQPAWTSGGANSSTVHQQQTTAYTSLMPAAANSTSEGLLLYTMFCRPDLPPSAGGSPGCNIKQLHIGFAMAITLKSDDDDGGMLTSERRRQQQRRQRRQRR